MAYLISPLVMETAYSRHLLQAVASTLPQGQSPIAAPSTATAAPALDDVRAFAVKPGHDLLVAGKAKNVLPLIQALCTRLATLKLMGISQHNNAAVNIDTAILLQFHYQCALATLLQHVPERPPRAHQLVAHVPWYPFGGFKAGSDTRNPDRPPPLMLTNVPWDVAMVYSIYCGFGCLTAMPLPLLEHAMAMLSYWVDPAQLAASCTTALIAAEYKDEPAAMMHHFIQNGVVPVRDTVGNFAIVNGFEVLFTVQCLLPFIWTGQNKLPRAGDDSDLDKVLVQSGVEQITCRELLRMKDIKTMFGTTEDDECKLYLCTGKHRNPADLLLRLCTRWFAHMRAPVLTGTSSQPAEEEEEQDDEVDAETDAAGSTRLNEQQRQIYMTTLAMIRWLAIRRQKRIPAQAVAGLLRLLASTVAPTARRLSKTAALFARVLRMQNTDQDGMTAAEFAHGVCMAALAADITYDEQLRPTSLHFTEFLHVLCLSIEKLSVVKRQPQELGRPTHCAYKRMLEARASKLRGPYRLPPFCLSLARLYNHWPEAKDGEDVWLQDLLLCWRGPMTRSIGALDESVTYSLSGHGMLWHGGAVSAYADFQRTSDLGFVQFLQGVFTAAPWPVAGFLTDTKLDQPGIAGITTQCHEASSAEAALLLCKHARGLSTLATRAARFAQTGHGETRQRMQAHLLGPISRLFDWNWIIREKDNYTNSVYSSAGGLPAYCEASKAALLLPSGVPPAVQPVVAPRWFIARSLLSLELHRLAAQFGNADVDAVSDEVVMGAIAAVAGKYTATVSGASLAQNSKSLPFALREYLRGEHVSVRSIERPVYCRMQRTSRRLLLCATGAIESVEHYNEPFVFFAAYANIWFYAARNWPGPKKRTEGADRHVNAALLLHLWSEADVSDSSDRSRASASRVEFLSLVQGFKLSTGDTLHALRRSKFIASLQWLLPDDDALLWDARIYGAVFDCALRRVTTAPEVDSIMLRLAAALGSTTDTRNIVECYTLSGRAPETAMIWQFTTAYQKSVGDSGNEVSMFMLRSADGEVFVAIGVGDEITAFELVLARPANFKGAPTMPVTRLIGDRRSHVNFFQGVARNITNSRSKLVLAPGVEQKIDVRLYRASHDGDFFRLSSSFEPFLADTKAPTHRVFEFIGLALHQNDGALQVTLTEPKLNVVAPDADVFAAANAVAVDRNSVPAGNAVADRVQLLDGRSISHQIKVVALPVRLN